MMKTNQIPKANLSTLQKQRIESFIDAIRSNRAQGKKLFIHHPVEFDELLKADVINSYNIHQIGIVANDVNNEYYYELLNEAELELEMVDINQAKEMLKHAAYFSFGRKAHLELLLQIADFEHDIDSQKQNLDKLITLDSFEPKWYAKRAEIHFQKAFYRAAIADYSKAYSLDENNSAHKANLAVAQYLERHTLQASSTANELYESSGIEWYGKQAHNWKKEGLLQLSL